jgi:hypothetical protein
LGTVCGFIQDNKIANRYTKATEVDAVTYLAKFFKAKANNVHQL